MSLNGAFFGTLGTLSLYIAVTNCDSLLSAIDFEPLLVLVGLLVFADRWKCPIYVLGLPALLLLLYNPTTCITGLLSYLFVRLRLQLSKFEVVLLLSAMYYCVHVAMNALGTLPSDNSFSTMSSIACIGILYVLSIGILGGGFLHSKCWCFSSVVTAFAMVGILLMFVHMYFAFSPSQRILPLEWIIQVLLDNSFARLKICIYWATVLLVSLPLVQYITVTYPQCMKNIVARKLFHFLSVLLFAPIISCDPDFMCLAFAVSLCGLLLVEYARCANLWNLNESIIGRYFDSFIDARYNPRSILILNAVEIAKEESQ